MATVRVRGIEEFDRKAKSLSAQMRSQKLRPILLAGASEIRDTVRQEAQFSSDTGAMVRSVVAKLAVQSDKAVAYAAVDTNLLTKKDKRGKIIRYPYIVNYGSRPHKIEAGEGKALRIGGGARVKSVQHPGFRGRQFFQRGVRRGLQPAKRVMERQLVEAVKEFA